MDAPKEVEATGEFECQLCGLTAPCMYYGPKPPNSPSIVILEEAYVMKDPFTPDKDKFIILGSHCSLCNRSMCVGTHLLVKDKKRGGIWGRKKEREQVSSLVANLSRR
ncbi:cysteine-rich DPF motif domain-containing protein 1 isoform X2 [Pithys albifrons albifrons]